MRLFQEESDFKDTSSAQYNDYMKVTSLRVWLVLGAIIFLLIGISLWIAVTTIDVTKEVQAAIENHVLSTQITSDEVVSKGMEINCEGQTTKLDTIEKQGNTYSIKAFIDKEDCKDITCTIVVEQIPLTSFFTAEGDNK